MCRNLVYKKIKVTKKGIKNIFHLPQVSLRTCAENATPTTSRMMSQPRRVFNAKDVKNRGLVRFDPGRYIVTENEREVCAKNVGF